MFDGGADGTGPHEDGRVGIVLQNIPQPLTPYLQAATHAPGESKTTLKVDRGFDRGFDREFDRPE